MPRSRAASRTLALFKGPAPKLMSETLTPVRPRVRNSLIFVASAGDGEAPWAAGTFSWASRAAAGNPARAVPRKPRRDRDFGAGATGALNRGIDLSLSGLKIEDTQSGVKMLPAPDKSFGSTALPIFQEIRRPFSIDLNLSARSESRARSNSLRHSRMKAAS